MTQDEMIALARKAGFGASNPFAPVIVRHSNGSWVSITVQLLRFAELVEQHLLLKQAMAVTAAVSPADAQAKLAALKQLLDAGHLQPSSLEPGEPPHRPGPMA